MSSLKVSGTSNISSCCIYHPPSRASLACSTHRKSTTKQTFFFKWQMSHTSSSFCKLMMDLCVNTKIICTKNANNAKQHTSHEILREQNWAIKRKGYQIEKQNKTENLLLLSKQFSFNRRRPTHHRLFEN